MSKAKANLAAKNPKEGRPTITSFVVELLGKNPTMGTDELIQKVCVNFPWSAFSKTHVAWYKHQIRAGKYVLANGVKLPPAKRKKKE